MQRRNRGVAAALWGAAGVWLCACSARADVVAGWNFNGLTAAVPPTLAADAGRGSAAFAEFTGGLGSLTGTDVNALAGDAAGQGLSITGSGQNGKAIVLEVVTTGLSQLSFSVAARRSASGHAVTAVEVWNGTDWQRAASFDASITQWQLHQFSLSSFAFLDNQAAARIRVKVDGATSGSGNIRFDNMRLEGVAVPAPGAAAALGAAGLAIGARRGGRAAEGEKPSTTKAEPSKRSGEHAPAQADGPASPSTAPAVPARRSSRARSSRGSG